MSDITIGRLRGGYCVSWRDGGKRKRYQLSARTRKEAEAEGRDKFVRETTRGGTLTIADLWALYVDSLGPKPTAVTMGYTGKAVLAHFGSYRPDQIHQDRLLCRPTPRGAYRGSYPPDQTHRCRADACRGPAYHKSLPISWA